MTLRRTSLGAIVAIVAAVAAVAALDESSGGLTSPEGAKLYLAGDGLTVVDVDSETARHHKIPEIGAGDPPYLIAPVGDRLAMWSYDVSSVPFTDPGAEPTLLAKDGWIFIPSTDPNAIWVGYLDAPPNRARRLDELREIDSSGQVLMRGVEPPGGAWPFAAASSGLIFYESKVFRLWDPGSERTVTTVPTKRIGDPGPVHGDLLASCGATCHDVLLTDFSDGSQRRVGGLDGHRLVSFEASFSPDGTKLAIPVLRGTGGWRSYSERGRRLAIVDLTTGVIETVARSHVPAGYVFTAWSEDGGQAFITGGQGTGKPRTIRAYRLGEPRAERIDVRVADFYALVAR